MSAQLQPKLTPEEYLALERQATCKSEYYNGEIFAMAGASRRHNLINIAISSFLYAKFRKTPCDVYSNDMRVKIETVGLYTYPDVVIVCDPPLFDDEHKDTLLNPNVIIEVLSDSTEDYDRGTKFKMYRTLTSLTDYLLVSQNSYNVEHYVKQSAHQWHLTEYQNLTDSITFSTIDCELKLADIYEKVNITE